MADAVVPISYAPDDGQHYHQLRVYKSPTAPNHTALIRLAALHYEFVKRHLSCLEAVAGGPFTHAAIVPSTRTRVGVHPLRRILHTTPHRLVEVAATANSLYGNEREYATDRFVVAPIATINGPPRILLLEDLWVTGVRAQSLVHALRAAGAETVVVIALGRRINRGYGLNEPLLAAASVRFDLGRCPIDS